MSSTGSMVWAGSERRWWEAPSEVSFEAAQGSFLGLAFGKFAFQERPGLGVDAGAGNRDDVKRPVELTVASAVESVLAMLPGGAGDRRDAGLQREAGVALEPFGAGGAADHDRSDQGAAAGLFKQPRALGFDQLEQLLLEFVDVAGQFANLGYQLARDPSPDGDRQPPQASLDSVKLARV
jgi:hypothetical protein